MAHYLWICQLFTHTILLFTLRYTITIKIIISFTYGISISVSIFLVIIPFFSFINLTIKIIFATCVQR